MKILYLIHQFYPMYSSGTEKTTLAIASNIQKNGNNVKILSYSSYEPDEYDMSYGNVLYRETFINEIPLIDFRLGNKLPNMSSELFVDEKNSLEMFAEFILGSEKPHLVHITHSMRTSIFVKVLQRLKIPYVLTLTDFFLMCPKVVLRNSNGQLCKGPEEGNECLESCPELSQLYIKKRLDHAREIIYNAKHRIVCSEFVAELYKKEYPDLDFLLIRHGMPFASVETNRKIYKQGDDLTFIYTGTLTEMKGVNILIDAFDRLRGDGGRLLIYGKAADDGFFEEFKEKIAGSTKIQYKGQFNKDHLGTVLTQADVMIVPSQSYETFSLVTHEALACNLPVICTDVPALNDKIKDGVNGLTFEMGSTDELTMQLQKVVDQPEVLNELKRNIFEEPMMILEQETYVYERVYNSCL